MLCLRSCSTPAEASSHALAEAYEAAKYHRGKFVYRKVPQDLYCLMAALRQGCPVMCAL